MDKLEKEKSVNASVGKEPSNRQGDTFELIRQKTLKIKIPSWIADRLRSKKKC
jgi:hypothetical protein